MNDTIAAECKSAIQELCEVAKLKCGDIVVVGCSTSEVLGSKVGTNSDPDTAKVIFQSIHDFLSSKGIYLAAQCCEHLNRAIVVEAEAVKGAEIVNVIPQPKAGGSFATAAYHSFREPVVVEDPVAVEEIRAHAGIDIGDTLIGMHLKKVAVPVRLKTTHIGAAILIAARTRPKFIGGVRAVYDQSRL